MPACFWNVLNVFRRKHEGVGGSALETRDSPDIFRLDEKPTVWDGWLLWVKAVESSSMLITFFLDLSVKIIYIYIPKHALNVLKSIFKVLF